MGKEWDRLEEPDWRVKGERVGVVAPARGRTAGLEHTPSIEERDDTPHHRAAVKQPSTLMRCANCGGNSSGEWNRCSCETPDFRSRSDLGRAMQDWHERWAREALRVLKPGGYLLAFGGTRTGHRLAAGLEDAGFEIRDTICWLYGQGFPKNADPLLRMRSLPRSTTRGAWRRWHRQARTAGTALKPGHEPITLARKPLAGPAALNMLAHGVGVLNVEAGRLPVADDAYARNHSGDRGHAGTREMAARGATDLRPGGGAASDIGRWPPNVALDTEAAEMLDAAAGPRRAGGNVSGREPSTPFDLVYGEMNGREPFRGYGDAGGPSRFFFCAKASRAERSAGLEELEARPLLWSSGEQNPGSFQSEGTDRSARNHHPTVKPIDLMRWLVRLVTPPGGLVLDPFAGSGTTGIACALEGFRFVGVEREQAYAVIAWLRIRFWREHGEEGLRIVAEREAAGRVRDERSAAGQLSLLS